jgi:hypothetical protein
MRAIPIVIAAALALAAGTPAAAQDTPPPGCRWMGETLACKDGRGNWRRAGDDEIVGTYPMPKAKPKPTARPKVAVAPRPAATPRPAAPPPAAPPPPQPALAPLPPVEAPPVYAEANAALPAVEAAEMAPATDAFIAPPQPTAAPAEPAKPKPWWRALLDWFSSQINELLKLVGLGK